MMSQNLPRRPLKSRKTGWAIFLANWFVKKSVNPNHISLAGIFFAVVAVVFLFLGSQPEVKSWDRLWFYFLAAFNIQLRLLCNMLDGMVAIEGQRQSKVGDLYNEIPDRIEDVIILVGAGYSVAHIFCVSILGWLAAIGAVLTAYIRVLGVTLGASAHFCGPMAKPHRMAVLTVACLLESAIFMQGKWLVFALLIIILGTLITCIRRVSLIRKELIS